MTDKEKKSKIADILMDFQEEYSNEVINRPMLASLYAGNILSFIDSMQEEPKTDWLQELQERLDSLSKEDFEKVWTKYKLREEGSVNYDKLNTMLDDALAKETKESLNERLDKKDFRERYKRIAQSESFKKAHEGISIDDAIPVEGEEPVSDDLEDKITDYINNHFSECEDGVLLSDAHGSELQYTDVADIARHFANWQKEKDMQKFLHSETATFTREEFDTEMEEVRKQTQEQMMKDMPKWKKHIKSLLVEGAEEIPCVLSNRLLAYHGYTIEIAELEKLPKED